MAASRWSVLVLAVVAVAVAAAAAAARVSCNGTIANAALQEMMDDPRSAWMSWGRVAKEVVDWGKLMIVEGLRLNRTGSKLAGDSALPTHDKGELLSNIPREATSRAYETADEASIRAERNRQYYSTKSSCENVNDDVNDNVDERVAAHRTQFAAIETSKHAKLWGDKVAETIRHITNKAKTAYEAKKVLLMKNVAIDENFKSQQVKDRVQESDSPKQKMQENVKENLKVVKYEATKHQEEMVEDEIETNETEIQNAQHAKETMANNKRKKAIKERKVTKESKEL